VRRVPVRLLELELELERQPAREQLRRPLRPVPILQQRHHNQQQRWPASKWHRASIGQSRFSTRRRSRCASYELLVRPPGRQRQQLRQRLQLYST